MKKVKRKPLCRPLFEITATRRHWTDGSRGATVRRLIGASSERSAIEKARVTLSGGMWTIDSVRFTGTDVFV